MKEFTYLGGRLSAGGGCEAAVTTRTRYGWIKFWECGELLYGERFSPLLRGVACKSYVVSANLCGSEAWCLKESGMRILRRTERSIVRAMCGAQINAGKNASDLMLLFGWNETIDHLAMASSVCWCGDVLRREDGHVLRREDDHVLRREDDHVLRRAL